MLDFKKTLKAIVLGANSILIACATIPAQAEEDPWKNTIWGGFSDFMNPNWEEDFSATVGVKVWMNEWRRDSFFGVSDNLLFIDGAGNPIALLTASSINSAPNAQTSDVEPTPIPQLSMRYKWLFVTGSYFSKTDYHFEPIQSFLTATFTDGIDVFSLDSVITTQTSASRYEYDVSAGVYVHPNIAILGGYKRIQQNFVFSETLTDRITGENFFRGRTPSNVNVEGPTIGIAGSVPIGNGFGIYANYAHGFMDVDINEGGSESNFDATYDVAELGFTYTYGMSHLPADLPLSSATFYAGYRWQNFETQFDASAGIPASSRSDTTRGFAAGFNLSWL